MTNSTKMKEKPTLLLKAVYEGAAMRQELENMRKQEQVLRDCGLDIEASKMQQKINTMNNAIKRKVDEAVEQRKVLIREMLLAFSAGDIATTCADKMESVFNRLAFGRDAQGGKALAEVFRLQAKESNKCVQMVDGQCGDERVSYLYADMSEEINEKIIPIMYEIIDRYMNSEKGKKIL